MTIINKKTTTIKIANDLQVDESQGENEDPICENIEGMS